MLRCYEPAHIAGVSKTAYVLATPRCLEWRRDLQPARDHTAPPDPDPQDARRRPARRPRGDRGSPRPPVAGVLAVVGAADRRSRPRATSCARRGRGAVPDGTTVFDDDDPGCRQARSGSPRRPARRPRRTPAIDVRRRQRLAFRRVPGAAAPRRRSRSTARKRRLPDGWPRPNTSAHVSGDAVDIGSVRRRAWLSEHGAEYGLCRIYANEPWHFELRPEAVDDGCPAIVRRPDPRSKDAAMIRERSPPLRWSRSSARAVARTRPPRPAPPHRHRRRRRQEADQAGEGGEVRRVHAGERRPALPRPGPEGRDRTSGST